MLCISLQELLFRNLHELILQKCPFLIEVCYMAGKLRLIYRVSLNRQGFKSPFFSLSASKRTTRMTLLKFSFQARLHKNLLNLSLDILPERRLLKHPHRGLFLIQFHLQPNLSFHLLLNDLQLPMIHDCESYRVLVLICFRIVELVGETGKLMRGI